MDIAIPVALARSNRRVNRVFRNVKAQFTAGKLLRWKQTYHSSISGRHLVDYFLKHTYFLTWAFAVKWQLTPQVQPEDTEAMNAELKALNDLMDQEYNARRRSTRNRINRI